MRHTILVLMLGFAAAGAWAQAKPEDHSAHHPEGAASGAAPSPAPSRPAAPAPDAIERQMRMMQDMHKRMQAARTPADKQALMADQMKVMQSGMEMMSRMGASGGMGSASRPDAAASAPGMQGMSGMMPMHAGMERRMAMMEQMMQMLVDRESAMPGR